MFNKKSNNVKVETKDEHWHCIECGCRIEGKRNDHRRWYIATPHWMIKEDMEIKGPELCDKCYSAKQVVQEEKHKIQEAIEKDRAERKEVSKKKPDIKKYLDETIAQLEKIKKELG